MQGLMQETPLTLPMMFRRAERIFGDKTVVTAGRKPADGGRRRSRPHDLRRLGRPHPAPGRRPRHPGDQPPTAGSATFAWNSARHLELYFAAPCTGRVLHTLNIRLFADQLTYIVNHAEDEVIFVDRTLLGLLWPLVDGLRDGPPHRGHGRHRCRRSGLPADLPDDPRIADYEELLAGRRARRVRGGGRGPGRGHVLHQRHHRQPQGRGVLPPLDRAALDGRDDGRQHRRVRARRGPAGRAHVPCQRLGAGPGRRVRRGQPGVPRARPVAARHRRPDGAPSGSPWPPVSPPSGWACCPCSTAGTCLVADPDRVRRFGRAQGPVGGVPGQIGLPILQAWGMTETSPLATVCRVAVDLRPARAEEELADVRATQGISVPGVELRIVEPGDDRGAAVGRRGQRRDPGPGPVDRPGLLRRPPAPATPSPPTGGCAPATSPPSPPTATSAWSTGPRT